MKKVPQHMNEEEYVEAYKNLPGLNERYVRALFRHNRGLLAYQDLLYAYESTNAHKQEVRVKKPWEIKTEKA